MRRLAVTTLLFAACAAPADDATVDDPNAGLLRDFQDGKYDSAGHPLNARVIDGAALCGGDTLGATCRAALPGGAQVGELQVNARIRVRAHAANGAILTMTVRGPDGEALGSETLTVARLRGRSSWIDLPVAWTSTGAEVAIELTPAPGATVDLDYVEVFPKRVGLVVSPGSGVISDDDHLTIELPRGHKLDRLLVDGVDLTARTTQLATRTTTNFRTVLDVAVGDLIPDRGDVADLRITAGNDSARMQLRRTPAACAYEGSGATKILVTGFQPFPANGWHENVSGVAVTAMNPANVRGARVMRMVLPVEYDRSAALVADAIARCAPDVVISFGQGGGAIALEEVAYNLQDTGEVAGGVPDNRGIVRAAVPIDETAPAERATLLPIDAIEDALVAIGEEPQHSRDPGRYICNNVMFVGVGTQTLRGGRAGFVHLPYTTAFDDATRARFGRIAETVAQAAL